MKKTFILFGSLIGFSITSFAQVVNEDVHFDFYQNATDHDFVNYFDAGNGLTQSQTGGITGGCLLTPDSVNWGNDNAIYCSHYKPVAGDTTVTSICFKYDSTTVNTGGYERAVSLFIRPNADYNHYVIASVAGIGNKKIEILSYGWNNNPYPSVSLFNDHWYRFELRALMITATSQVHVKAEVFDLGLTGTGSALSVNSASGLFADSTLAADTSIQVSFTATAFGGAGMADDFHFHGGKGQSICPVSTGITGVKGDHLKAYPVLSQNVIHVDGNEAGREMIMVLYDARGKKMTEQKTNQVQSDIYTGNLVNGIYFLNCLSGGKSTTFKIALVK